jgi:hypothetical protein
VQTSPASTIRALAAIFALSAIAPCADAQDREAQARARELFREGVALADTGDWERAVHRFRRALERYESPSVRYNLAHSLSRMGRLVEARGELDLVRADPDAPPEVWQAAEELRREIEPRIGRMIIAVHGDLDGASVMLDGRPIADHLLGRSVPSDPGVRVVRLLRGSEELDHAEVDVPEGGASEVSLQSRPPILAAPRARPRPAPPASDDGWIWGLSIGAALVAIGIAVVVGVSMSEQSGSNLMGDFTPPVLEID